MTWHDGRFMRHTRFRYWLLDTSLRVMTPGMQRTFFRTREAATAYTLEDLEDKNVRKNLVQQMSSATSQLPGSVGERRKMRQELESMVHQLEAETADNGENGGAGHMPAGFCTLTCPVYKWHQLHEAILKSLPSAAAQDCNTSQIHEAWKDMSPSLARDEAMKKAFYEVAVLNPGAVAWYCSLKLEMAVLLTKQLLTQQMRSEQIPGHAAVQARIANEVRARLGLPVDVEFECDDLSYMGHVDDYYASFEWSSGGMLHAHMAFWIVGSPRIDKVVVPKELHGNVVEIMPQCEDSEFVLPQTEAASRMASCYDRVYTEWNVAKALSAPVASKTLSGASDPAPDDDLACDMGV